MVQVFQEKGLSLLEMILVIMVIGVLAVAISPVLRGIVHAYNRSTVINEEYQAARIGLNRMLNEIRMIPDFASILNSTSGYIRFQDFDGNTISYLEEGSRIWRNQNGVAWRRLVENVSSFSITYYDLDGNIVNTPTMAEHYARIEINMGIRLLGQSANFSGEVSPRNIMLQIAASG